MAINRIKTGGITDGTIQSGDIAPGTIASDRLAEPVANANHKTQQLQLMVHLLLRRASNSINRLTAVTVARWFYTINGRSA